MISGGRIAYLDYDGVLHPDAVYWKLKKGIFLDGPGTLFEHARILEHLLEPWPDVQLVLSTSWVPMFSFSRARRFLPEGLKKRVIGSTWHSSMRSDWEWKNWWETASRFDTILQDVMRRRPAAWIALDDDVADWDPRLSNHLVATQGNQGLNDRAVQNRLTQKLIELHNPGQLGMPLPFGERDLLKPRHSTSL